MESIKIKFKILTPCILGGADQTKAEIRVPSLLGELHWWYRVLGGMQEDERAIFGGIVTDDKGENHAKASSLIVRITDNHCVSSDSQNAELYKSYSRPNHPYLLFPLRSVSRGIIYPSPTSTFTLSIQRKPLIKAPDIGIKKILVFSLLASLGSRSRRGFGSLWPTEINYFGKSVLIPTDKIFFTNILTSCECDKMGIEIVSVGKGKKQEKEAISDIETFLKTYRSEGAKKESGLGRGSQKGFRAVFGLPLKTGKGASLNHMPQEHARENDYRWASPLRFKVIELNKEYFPIAIFCNKMVMKPQQMIIKQVNKTYFMDNSLWDQMKSEEHNLPGLYKEALL